MDQYIGERFENKDPRSEGRVIQVIEAANEPGKYIAEVKVHPKNPSAIGRNVTISAETLESRYTKVSH